VEVPPIATPFDAFMSEMLVWFETQSYLWVAVGILAVVAVVSAVVAKRRHRIYEGEPHYFRGDS
jgi:hypothetical protein